MRTDIISEPFPATTVVGAASAQSAGATGDVPAIKPVANSERSGLDTGSEARSFVAQRLAARGPSRDGLLIERDEELGRYIYKSVDRETGEVRKIWPIGEVRAAVAEVEGVDARGLTLDTRT